jgi:hypothetical protein
MKRFAVVAVLLAVVAVFAATKTTSKTGTTGLQGDREFQQELRVKFNAAVDDIDTLMASVTGGDAAHDSVSATALDVQRVYVDSIKGGAVYVAGRVDVDTVQQDTLTVTGMLECDTLVGSLVATGTLKTVGAATLASVAGVVNTGRMNLSVGTAIGDTTFPANSPAIWLCSKTGGTKCTITIPAAAGNAGDVYILRGNVTDDTCIVMAGTTLIDSLISVETFRLAITGANAGFLW